MNETTLLLCEYRQWPILLQPTREALRPPQRSTHLIAQRTITSNQDVPSHSLSEHLNLESIGDDFLGFTIDIWVNQRDVVVALMMTTTTIIIESFQSISDSFGMFKGGKQHLQAITLPKALNLSSIRWIATLGGREFLRCWSS